MARGYVITGTDTGVGKTIVAAGLTGEFRATYWKPIQAGVGEPTDSEIVEELAGHRMSGIVREAYRLRTPCSPHEAASLEGLSIHPARLSLPLGVPPLIVEGAGGVLVPINEHQLMIDLFVMWALPVILVARTALGTINHSLLSIRALRGAGLEIAGMIFVGDARPPSEVAVSQFGAVRHLGRLPWLHDLNRHSLAVAVREHLRLDLLS